MKLIVSEEKCVAAGQCVAIAPALFDQRDDDGVVILIEKNPPHDQHDAARRAILACPAQALAFEE